MRTASQHRKGHIRSQTRPQKSNSVRTCTHWDVYLLFMTVLAVGLASAPALSAEVPTVPGGSADLLVLWAGLGLLAGAAAGIGVSYLYLKFRLLRNSAEQYGWLHSDDLFRLVIDSMPGDLAYYDSDLNVLFANQRFCDYLNLPMSEVVGKHVSEFQSGISVQPSFKSYQTIMDGKPVFEVVTRESPDGSLAHFNVHYIPRSDSTGRVIGIFVMALDVSDRENALIELRKTEEMTRLITDSMPAIMCYYDANLHVRFANKPFGEWFDVDVDYIVNRHARDVRGEEHFQKSLSYYKRVMAG